jgi:hypothetical protein
MADRDCPVTGRTEAGAPRFSCGPGCAIVDPGNCFSSEGIPAGASSASRSARINRLAADSPARSDGPFSPPASNASRESTRSLPLSFSPPWHLKHLRTRTGRTLVSICSIARSSAIAAGVYAAKLNQTNRTACRTASSEAEFETRNSLESSVARRSNQSWPIISQEVGEVRLGEPGWLGYVTEGFKWGPRISWG